tara:strand:+ start:531 stop:914 length:384 start_codon:yes stop_codon:yes gene_type:complete
MAVRAGKPDAFHVTLTRAWFDLIVLVDDVDAAQELLNKSIIRRFYSAERIAAGRTLWLSDLGAGLGYTRNASLCSSTEEQLRPKEQVGGSNPSRGTAQRDVFLCPTLDSNIRDGSAGRTPFGAHVYP